MRFVLDNSVAMREGVPLATLNGDLRSAMSQTGVALV